ncbi:MAG: fluoride efflux transporter CrcB [Rhodospirillaceae bacterium]|jgi:fluoride exporter|nr:fluoride efflux transporter CrcB [Rhodospirillaceae bacterium]MBT6137042.1 fluoride efflux transporter CrcB [Rhodospirillaceae bacterium]
MKMILAVALGGAVGAVARYKVTAMFLHLFGSGFPYGTLFVNVVGSFAMGVLIELLALKIELSQEVRAMIVTGVLGAFTTFSTFSLDVAYLWERGNLAGTALYVAGSVVLAIGALFGAMALVRWMVS